MRSAPLALGALLALGSSCRKDPKVETITLSVPDGSGRPIELRPAAAFAEHVEVPELGHELRITLASYPVSCGEYRAPGADDTALFLTLRTASDSPPKAGSYGLTWHAPLADAGPPEATPDDAGLGDAGAEQRRPQAPSLGALVRRGPRGYPLKPGGQVELRGVDLGPGGRVQGTLALEFPGTASEPASSARGRFEATLCRTTTP